MTVSRGEPRNQGTTTTRTDMAGASRAIVLVHGSFVDASCWTDIATELRARDHRTETVELHRGSLRADAEAVQQVVDAIGTPVVACGWSYGGAVITGVDLPPGSHLVYLCALMPDEDESPMALGERHPGGIDEPLGVDGAGDLVLSGDKLDGILWGDATPAKAAAARATLRSQSITSFLETPPRVAWRTTPSTFVIGRDDAVFSRALIDEMAKRATEVIEWPTSHSPVLSRPDLVVDLLDRLSSGDA